MMASTGIPDTRRPRSFRGIGSVTLGLTLGMMVLGAEPGDVLKGEWTQWRGPNRDGISSETGFLKSWSKEGPRIVWRARLGEGFSGISVSQGRGYTMYAQGNDEFVVCLETATGKILWQFRSDAKFPDYQGGHGPRSTPTIDDGRVFALSAHGKLYSLHEETGKVLWQRDLKKEYGSKTPQWGFATSPLVEGDLLLIEAGGHPFTNPGDSQNIIAFDKKSGQVMWTSPAGKPAYSSPIAATVGGIRQIIFFPAPGLVSVSPIDGRILWRYGWKTSYDVNAATPIFIPPDKIFLSSGYGRGAAVLQIKQARGRLKVEEVWKSRVMKNQFSSSVLSGNYLYGFDMTILKCIEADTGKERWKKRGFGKGSLILADDHLIILSDAGKLALVEASPSHYEEKASAKVLSGRCWTVPTLAGGKLYLRSHKEIVCLDLTDRSK